MNPLGKFQFQQLRRGETGLLPADGGVGGSFTALCNCPTLSHTLPQLADSILRRAEEFGKKIRRKKRKRSPPCSATNKTREKKSRRDD